MSTDQKSILPWHATERGPYTSEKFNEIRQAVYWLIVHSEKMTDEWSKSVLVTLIDRFGIAPAPNGGPCADCGWHSGDGCECAAYHPATLDVLYQRQGEELEVVAKKLAWRETELTQACDAGADETKRADAARALAEERRVEVVRLAKALELRLDERNGAGAELERIKAELARRPPVTQDDDLCTCGHWHFTAAVGSYAAAGQCSKYGCGCATYQPAAPRPATQDATAAGAFEHGSPPLFRSIAEIANTTRRAFEDAFKSDPRTAVLREVAIHAVASCTPCGGTGKTPGMWLRGVNIPCPRCTPLREALARMEATP